MKQQPFMRVLQKTLTRVKFRSRSKTLRYRPFSSSTLPRLPNELIELILDYLYFDTPTLLRCALVGRSWVYPSQRGIFREIVLEILADCYSKRGYMKLTRSFLRIDALLANPRLASYVQSLKLYGFSKSSSLNIVDRDPLTVATESIVQRLSNVNKLSLKLVVWEGLSPSLKEALTAMLGSPSLRELSFTMFSIPTFAAMASLLSLATHLKVLHTDNWESRGPVGTMSEIEGIGAPQSIQLDRLQFTSTNRGDYWGGNSNVDHYSTWFQQERCLFDIRNLQSLQIGISSFTLAKLLQLTGNNLRELDVRDISSEITKDPADAAVPLTYVTNLRKLTLHFIKTDLHSALPWIQGILKPLLNYGNVTPPQHMVIYFSGLFIFNGAELRNHLAALDRLLLTTEFAQLETVKIVIGVIFFSPYGVEELFRKSLASSEGSGKLTTILIEGNKMERTGYTSKSKRPGFIWKYSRART